MNFLSCLLVNNPCYRAGVALKPKGIVVHSTGANNPNLRRYVQPAVGQTEGMGGKSSAALLQLLGKNENGNHWNGVTSPAVCVHGFIGRLADGTVATVQTLPFTVRCWGCGSGSKGSYNSSHIQFEICEDGMESPDYLNQVWQEAVELCAELCRRYGIPVSAIRSHAESHRDGYATNHGDPEHWFTRFGRTMDQFRTAVSKALAGQSEPALSEETVQQVQRRFGFSNDTMAYLKAYRFAAALLKKLAEQP